MREEELKTSPKQRIVIGAIAVIMVLTMIVSYAIIVAGGNKNSSSSQSTISSEKIAEYELAYRDKANSFKESTASQYEAFSPYLSRIKAYNETSANEGDLSTTDLLIGTGRELTTDDVDYLAFYVGWCADETIFDSSLDDRKNPTGFAKAINAANGMIEGWKNGVIGMRLGGIREITIPSELAYGSQMEICGGYNKPLKFIVMPVANEEPLSSDASSLDMAYQRMLYAENGIDYDELIKKSTKQ